MESRPRRHRAGKGGMIMVDYLAYYIQDDRRHNGTWTLRYGRNGIVEDVFATKRAAKAALLKLWRLASIA